MPVPVDLKKSVLQRINLNFSNSIELYLLRLDLIDTDISGNKWFKLKHNIIEMQRQKKNTLLTYGGAFSNHIAATAKACKIYGVNAVGIIRGEEVNNHTLNQARKNGMKLFFVTRQLYRSKELLKQYTLQQFSENEIYIVPEGGANTLGAQGSKEIADLINVPFNYLVMACGTGTTLAGVASVLKTQQKVIGIPVLKGAYFLEKEIISLSANEALGNFELCYDYHFGGYAKYTLELIGFIQEFKQQYNIELDFVYTGKMMYGVFDLIKQKYFPDNSVVIVIHSGGIQGNLGIGL